MTDLRPVLFVLGAVLAALALTMTVPALVDAARGDPSWRGFSISAAIALFVGGALMLGARPGRIELHLRQALLLTPIGWIVAAAFAALPFQFAGAGLNYSGAFFEAMSGLTSTGATVIANLDFAPNGILLWRAMLNWIGGLVIVLVAVAVLPLARIGGMQLFRSEAFDRPEQFLTGAMRLLASVGVLYLAATALGAAALWAAGMHRFDAVVHAMTAISTGGFSTREDQSAAIAVGAAPWVLMVLMVLGSLPFLLYVEALQGRGRRLFADSQVRWFLATVLAFAAAIALWRWLVQDQPLAPSIAQSLFAVVSTATGTGFQIAPELATSGLTFAALFFLMFVGGCAGSSACGIKIFRFHVAFAIGRAHVHKLVEPHGVFVMQYNRQPVTDDVIASVMGFFLVFALGYGIVALGLTALGVDLVSALTGAAAIVANVGPAFGGDYAEFPEGARWLLCAGMLFGRLEFFAVLILFSPHVWGP